MNDQVLDETKLRSLVKSLRLLMIAFGVLIVVGGVTLVVQNYRRSQAEKGFAELAAVEVMETDAANQAQTLNMTRDEAMKKWPDDKKAQYEAKLKSVSDAFAGSAPGASAALKLAHWKLTNEKYDEAVAIFEGIIQKTDSSALLLLKAMAMEGLAATREAQKNLEESLKIYTQAIDLKNNPLKPLAYLGKGRVAAALGKTEDAKAAFEAIAKEFPNTGYERRARALQALLLGG